LRAGNVTGTSSSCGWDTEEDANILVLADRLGPVIPDIKVEGILGCRARSKVGNATPVVVELNHDEIKGKIATEHGVVCSIWEYTLRCSRKVESLATTGHGSVHMAS
jgi:hypothetical protein